MSDLNDVEVGDKLLVTVRGRRFLTSVERLTKTQVITTRGKYWKKNGNSVGSYDALRVPLARKATPEILEKMEKQELAHHIKHRLNRLTNIDTLLAIGEKFPFLKGDKDE